MPFLSRDTTTQVLFFSILSFVVRARPAAANVIDLPSEIVAFVPSCASACFSTFVNNNFPLGICGKDPTFQCLCEHAGTNGFTVGEGALACIASEDSTGRCTGTEVSCDDCLEEGIFYVFWPQQRGPRNARNHRGLAGDPVPVHQNCNDDSRWKYEREHERKHRESHGNPNYLKVIRLCINSNADHIDEQCYSVHRVSPVNCTAPKSASNTSSAQTSATSDQTQRSNGIRSLSVAQIVGISVGTATALFFAIALSIYLRFLRRRRLMLVPRLTGDGNEGGGGGGDEEGLQKRVRPRTGHELQISAPVNLQGPTHPSNSTGPLWQEKYKTSRTAPRDTQNNQDAENRPNPPPKSPPRILLTRPTLEGSVNDASRVPVERYNRNLTPRTIYGQVKNLPLKDIQDPVQTTKNISPTQSSVPPSLLIRPPPQSIAPDRRMLEEPVATISRPVPYPSYYGIPPDEDHLYGGYPQQAKYTEKTSLSTRPVEAQPVQPERNLPSMFQPPLTSRDSIVTEFAEDGEDNLSPRATDDGLYPSRRFTSRQDLSHTPPDAQHGGYSAPISTFQEPQLRPQPSRQPLPQFQIQPHHQPQLRPQPPPQTPSPRAQGDDPARGVQPPYMSPSLVPRPLDVGTRNPGRNTGRSGPTLDMPVGAGSNVSQMAKMRLGDERALGLRLVGDGRSQRPRQNAGWRRMDDNFGEY
ncbi:uncharacterized protein SPSK_05028 [Sporothrix schenckii 1099-18]|uniref:Extracellular membrane protein CFEM domain-containing protein n=1 Tax=Sporothrix schenckii 1099-18 TaxID=1397361 RepID=A0A0F2LXD4_SPOSC|nr:uncharacterized protein SPSK_05028 [Sporothrix schenckii 1099-18]KJR81160.1 hypothetical protein SPSK_05028 [Sporothrix schenckii 1099-18]